MAAPIEFDDIGVFAAVHIIDIATGYNDNGDDEEYYINQILDSPVPPGAEIGDLIVDQNMADYRTDGVYIVDHDYQIKELSNFPDDYGTLPEEFQVWVFINPRTNRVVNYDYWHGALTGGPEVCGARWHSDAIYFDPGNLNLHFTGENILLHYINEEDDETLCVTFDIGDGNLYYIFNLNNETEEEFLAILNSQSFLINREQDIESAEIEDGAIKFSIVRAVDV